MPQCCPLCWHRATLGGRSAKPDVAPAKRRYRKLAIGRSKPARNCAAFTVLLAINYQLSAALRFNIGSYFGGQFSEPEIHGGQFNRALKFLGRYCQSFIPPIPNDLLRAGQCCPTIATQQGIHRV